MPEMTYASWKKPYALCGDQSWSAQVIILHCRSSLRGASVIHESEWMARKSFHVFLKKGTSLIAHHHVCQKSRCRSPRRCICMSLWNKRSLMSCVEKLNVWILHRLIMSASIQLPPTIQSHASDPQISHRSERVLFFWSLCVGPVTKQQRVRGVSHL